MVTELFYGAERGGDITRNVNVVDRGSLLKILLYQGLEVLIATAASICSPASFASCINLTCAVSLIPAFNSME